MVVVEANSNNGVAMDRLWGTWVSITDASYDIIHLKANIVEKDMYIVS